MKTRLVHLLPLLLLGLFSFLLLLACPQPQNGPTVDGEGELRNVVSAWFGTYISSGDGGTIESWTLYDNDTFGGNWTSDDEAFSITLSGTYALTGTDIYFDMAGMAASEGAISRYTGSGEGVISEDTGAGTYSIDFSHPEFDDQYDETWEIHTLEGESGFYTIETFSNGGTGEPDTYLYLLDSNEIEITSNDDDGFSLYSRIEYPLISGTTYYILVNDIYMRPGYYSLLVSKDGGGSSSEIPATDAGEPDGDAANAVGISLNTTYDRFLTSNDQDWFVVTIP